MPYKIHDIENKLTLVLNVYFNLGSVLKCIQNIHVQWTVLN